MPKEDANALVEGYRGALREALSQLDTAALMRLRGELQVVARWLEVHDEAEAKRSADAALDAVTRFAQFGGEIGGFSLSARSAERASMFDLASVGVLAIENVVTAEKASLMRILMAGLSEALMFVGSRQYVAGSDAVLRVIYRTHAIAVQDALWSLATDFRDPEALESIREARGAIASLFAKFDDPAVPLATRVALLHQLYGLAAIIRCAKLLKDLRDLARAPSENR